MILQLFADVLKKESYKRKCISKTSQLFSKRVLLSQQKVMIMVMGIIIKSLKIKENDFLDLTVK